MKTPKQIFEEYHKEVGTSKKRLIIWIIDDKTFEYDTFKEKCAFNGLDVQWKIVAKYKRRGEEQIREEVIYEEDDEWLDEEDWHGYD